jgi:phospholipase/carboxylesterase
VTDLGFIHRFEPGRSSRTLLLLHGTGGNENDLLDFGRAIDPDAALLSPRGKVLEHGAPRFFRRLAEGVFDEEDVIRRAHELSEFVEAAGRQYAIGPGQLVAIGYSNGANIAAAMILLGLSGFAKAILFRPMVPLSHLESRADLAGMHALLSAGKFDPIAQPSIVGTLAGLLRDGGAEVTVKIHASGHELISEDLTVARHWLTGGLTSKDPL